MLDNIKLILGSWFAAILLMIGMVIYVFIELCVTPKDEKIKEKRAY